MVKLKYEKCLGSCVVTEEDIKHNFSQNLINLRKAKGLTQLQLAEKLNYTDKAISKWEVGSVLPDVGTLQNIAEFFSVTVNDLIYTKKKNILKTFYKNHLFITLLVFMAIWFLSTIIYFVLDNVTVLNRCWLVFVYTIPISSISLIVFTAMWFKKIFVYLSSSLFLWGIIISVFLTINLNALWFIFIIGVVGQVVISFAMPLATKKKFNK